MEEQTLFPDMEATKPKNKKKAIRSLLTNRKQRQVNNVIKSLINEKNVRPGREAINRKKITF